MLTEDEALEEALAIPMGAGIGLTFDEAALLLDLRDVYWTRQGLLSVQLSPRRHRDPQHRDPHPADPAARRATQESTGQIPPPPHATVPA